MNKIAVIIIFYNSLIKDSQAYNLLQDKRLELFLADNSVDQNILAQNLSFAKSHNLHYYQNQGNIGLSKSYNKMIKIIKETNQFQYVLFSDDDTLYTQEYIDKLYKAVSVKKADVIMPIVKDSYDQCIISPAFSTKIPLIPYKEGGKLKINKVYGINSGTCAKLSCFDNWQFNEDIFLYFVDSDFFVNCVNKYHHSYYILDCEIQQNLSSSEPFSDAFLKRMQLVLKDARPYTKNQSFPHLRVFIHKICLIKRFYNQHHDKRIFQILKY